MIGWRGFDRGHRERVFQTPAPTPETLRIEGALGSSPRDRRAASSSYMSGGLSSAGSGVWAEGALGAGAGFLLLDSGPERRRVGAETELFHPIVRPRSRSLATLCHLSRRSWRGVSSAHTRPPGRATLFCYPAVVRPKLGE